MTELPLELDHVGVAVHDLDEVQRVYSRLGFTLTPRSIHAGSYEPGGPVKPLGSGNNCAMFQSGYLELLGVTDAGLPNHATPFLEKYQGVHIVAFGLKDAPAAREVLADRNPGVQQISMLERDASFGPEGAETRRARFANIYLDDGVIPEAYLIFIEHLTRDVLWQPHLLDHPNGAVAMQEVVFCADDPVAAAGRLSRLLGTSARGKAPETLAIDLPRGRVYVMSPAALGEWAPGASPPYLPCVAGFGVTVSDLSQTRSYLDKQDIAFRTLPYPAIQLDPEVTMGPIISFIQA